MIILYFIMQKFCWKIQIEDMKIIIRENIVTTKNYRDLGILYS